MKILEKIVKNALKKKGLRIVREDKFNRQQAQVEFSDRVFRNATGSRSQLFQDLFVLSETNGKEDGFFVEFGATNGVDLSNTYLLEKRYGWTGILAEPARYWGEQLRKNRNVTIDFRCVWSESGKKLEFNETESRELSTIDVFSSRDAHAGRRESGLRYYIETVSLLDLLKQNNAPQVIDYLSIDTEGSELDILSAFDFSKYDIKIITCEHNYTSDREKIHLLLTANGYQRKYTDLSFFDDWYVRE